MQKVLICIQTNHTLDEDNDMEFETEEFYIKSRQEMEFAIPDCAEAMDNTVKIAERCHVDFQFGHHILPLYIAPDGRENVEFFRDMCYQGLYRHYGENPANMAEAKAWALETGISDAQNVEIISGIQEMDEVFVNYTVTDYSGSW